MRACEGCRRRKIKCDAATTNTWPCSACQRLKLTCIPPMVQYDRDFAANQIVMEHEQNVEFGDSSGSGEDDLAHGGLRKRASVAYAAGPARDGHGYRTLSPQEPHAGVPYAALATVDVDFAAPVYQQQPVMRPPEQWAADTDIPADLVGALKIDDSGIGGSPVSSLGVWVRGQASHASQPGGRCSSTQTPNVGRS